MCLYGCPESHSPAQQLTGVRAEQEEVCSAAAAALVQGRAEEQAPAAALGQEHATAAGQAAQCRAGLRERAQQAALLHLNGKRGRRPAVQRQQAQQPVGRAGQHGAGRWVGSRPAGIARDFMTQQRPWIAAAGEQQQGSKGGTHAAAATAAGGGGDARGVRSIARGCRLFRSLNVNPSTRLTGPQGLRVSSSWTAGELGHGATGRGLQSAGRGPGMRRVAPDRSIGLVAPPHFPSWIPSCPKGLQGPFHQSILPADRRYPGLRLEIGALPAGAAPKGCAAAHLLAVRAHNICSSVHGRRQPRCLRPARLPPARRLLPPLTAISSACCPCPAPRSP